MDQSDVRAQAGRLRESRRSAFELAASKLHRPPVPTGSVRRLTLIDRLRNGAPRPVVSVIAPTGYGKTTLLSQWAEADGRAFAWVSIDERDNDPKVLFTYVAAALDMMEPVGQRVFDALASPSSSVLGTVVPRLGSAFSSMSSPVALVLDDVHLLRNPECRAALPVLADHVPGGSQLVLAGRDAPPLPVARLRTARKITEIGPRDLALSLDEASSLLREAGIALGEDEVAELHQRTEGWPAGLYLAVLSLREGGSVKDAVASFTGEHHLVSQYLQAEFLARISRRQRVFLTRTAVLEHMCDPLCEAVLDQHGATATLADLAGSNLLLVPLDRRGQWYRYHHLFRDLLLAELERVEPGLIPVLRRRAADWCARNSLPEEALEYSIAAEDVDGAARLTETLAVPARWQGRVSTVQRWFQWLDERGEIDKRPMLAALAGNIAAMAGRAAEAERWAEVVDRWQDGDVARPYDLAAGLWAAVLRVMLCRRGIEQMRADADEAARRCAAAGIAAPPAIPLAQGIARVLSGDLDGGDAAFQHVVSMRREAGAAEAFAIALCEQSLVAMARGEWGRAEALAGQARTLLRDARMVESFVTPLVCAVQARTALHRGDIPAARHELVHAQRLRHELTYAVPHLAVQARIELARASIALADPAGARTLMREIDELLRRRPGLGTLASQAVELRAQLSRLHSQSVLGASALTAAELRLLPMLATHLSYPEIAGQLSVSRSTVKVQGTSIYRKLEVSSRDQAVTRARDLGLLDP